MKKIRKLLVVFMVLLGVISFSKNIDEAEQIEKNKILERIYTRLDSEIAKYHELGKTDKTEFTKRIIIVLESELEKDKKGIVAGILGEVYSGSSFLGSPDYLNFEDRMKLSEKYLLISMEKGNVETSYIYLCYIYALQKKYDLSEKYYEKFKEYYKKNNSDINFLDARTERMLSNEIKAALIYRIVLDDEDGKYSFNILHEIMEEFIPMYPPNYDIMIKYTLRAVELGHAEFKKDLGDLYYKKGDLKLAEKYYNEFLELKNIENYFITDNNKLDCIKNLENLLDRQGRKLDQKYIIMLKELESKISKE